MSGPGGYLPVHDKAHRMMQAVRLGIPSHNPVLKSHVFLQKFRRLLNIRTLFQLFHGHRDNKPGHADFPPRALVFSNCSAHCSGVVFPITNRGEGTAPEI